jgi:hypothetical protein
MAKTYHKPSPELTGLVERMMEEFHDDLTAHRVRVGCRFCVGDLKLHGYPCAAVVQIMSYERRFQGAPDAMVTVDKIAWDGLSEEEKAAVIDHELEHLAIARDKQGQARVDDLGRPKLRMRLHNLIVGGFRSIIDRHGKAALEYGHVARVNEALRQMSLQWGDDMGPQTDPTEDSDTRIQFAAPDGETVETDLPTLQRVADAVAGKGRRKPA